jgi:CelD/BcsL family acetyltransferase involved in cellulose biosynthesis
MKVDCTSLTAAIGRHNHAWESLRSANVGLDSPFFAPQFYQAVGSISSNVEVATVEDDRSELVALWPFERVGRRAVSVAAPICEITGAICQSGAPWDPLAVLEHCDLREWTYDCSPALQAAFAPYHLRHRSSPVIDLRGGWDAYQSELRGRGSSLLRQTARKTRRLSETCGEPEFVWDDKNSLALDCLIRWKQAQYRDTGTRNVMQNDWFRALVDRFCELDSDRFTGLLSTLYVQGRPIAAHFGIRSSAVLAWWFPAYDPEFAHYSPGNTLLIKLIEAASRAGVTRIDLGQGDERYKGSFSNGAIAVAEGVVSRRIWRRAARQTWIHARDWAQGDPRCHKALQLFRKLRHCS